MLAEKLKIITAPSSIKIFSYSSPYDGIVVSPPSDLIWYQRDNSVWFSFRQLSIFENFRHGVFSRVGGFSQTPYAECNVSFKLGNREDTLKNYLKIADNIGTKKIVHIQQVHGDTIENISLWPEAEIVPIADAMVTDLHDLGLMIKLADCQGIIIYDPVKHVLGMVHSGWRGNVINIVSKAIDKMVLDYDCNPSDMHTAFGPSLGPCCAEFKSWRDIFPEYFEQFMTVDNYFDLWAITCYQLINAGVKPEHIELAAICTKCNRSWFFSYRGEVETGRFGVIAFLNPLGYSSSC